MLHPDSERRIADINQMSNLFKQKGYPKTATEILTFAEILKNNKVPNDFLSKLDAVFVLFQDEFVNSLPVGQDYRKRCFEEIKVVVFQAIGRMRSDYAKALLTIYPILKRLNNANKITGAIAEELGSRRIKDKYVIFHLHCYAYLILVEGIFDELARILYFLNVVSKNNIPSAQQLEKLTIWEILEKLKPKPVFLENWKEKNHMRNSIGHARADYDPTKDTIQFVDVDEKKNTATYDSGLIPLSEFVRKALEIEDSLSAFYNTFILLRIYDMIMSENPYQ